MGKRNEGYSSNKRSSSLVSFASPAKTWAALSQDLSTQEQLKGKKDLFLIVITNLIRPCKEIDRHKNVVNC